MIEQLEGGIKIAEVIIEPIERLFKGLLSIKDKRRKKAELKRLMTLLDTTRISRTLNAGFVYYLKRSIESYQSNGKEGSMPKDEISVVVAQLEKGIESIVTIINEMVAKTDKVLIYQNRAWTDLSIIVNERGNLLNEFRNLKLDENNIRLLESFASKYEIMTHKLGDISFKISQYARAMDEE